MPLPFALDHINLWLLEDGPGWTIVDTGYAMPETKAAWERIFAEQLGGRPVTRIIVTHFHPDHIGLAGWLAERWQAPLWITEKEWLYARVMSRGSDDFVRAAPRFCPPRRARRRRQRIVRRARKRLPARACRRCRRPFAALPTAWRSRSAGGSGGSSSARAMRPELACLYCPRIERADRRRPGLAKDFAQCQRSAARARRRPAGQLSRFARQAARSGARQTPWCCRRTICRFTACMRASTNWRRITRRDAKKLSRP